MGKAFFLWLPRNRPVLCTLSGGSELIRCCAEVLLVTTVVFLVRHAAHSEVGQRLTGRRAGVQLSEAGERQAVALGSRLSREPLSAIYSSPRDRARATADTIARYAGIPVEVTPALDEIDFGDWTGASFEELAEEPLWRRWNEARGTSCPPGGETMAEATARIVGQIEHAAEAHAGSAVALVSHCDMIRGAVAHFLGLPVDHMLRFDIEPASLSTLHIGAWGARIASLNEKAGQ